MPKSTLIIIFILFNLSILRSQEVQPENSAGRYQKLDASYIFGGQIYNNNFIYNPGFSFQLTYGLQLNESVGIGLGTGYTALKDENFLPFFLEATGKRRSGARITMQLGYSVGWYSGAMEIDGYKFRGGIFIDAGLGREVPVNSTYSLYFHWSYRHQFARMDYKVFGGQDYTEAMNYDMIVISLGIIRHGR